MVYKCALTCARHSLAQIFLFVKFRLDKEKKRDKVIVNYGNLKKKNRKYYPTEKKKEKVIYLTEKRSIDDRILLLQEKQKKLKEQERKLKSKKSAEERKARTRNLIRIGGAVYSVLGDSYQEGDVDKLIAFLKQQNKRGNYFSSAMGRLTKSDIVEE